MTCELGNYIPVYVVSNFDIDSSKNDSYLRLTSNKKKNIVLNGMPISSAKRVPPASSFSRNLMVFKKFMCLHCCVITCAEISHRFNIGRYFASCD